MIVTIANQEDVLSEFARVMKEGGIAGFSEPGRNHSRSPQAQFEMSNFNVLENDIDVNKLFITAKRVGFSNFELTDSPLNKVSTVFFLWASLKID